MSKYAGYGFSRKHPMLAALCPGARSGAPVLLMLTLFVLRTVLRTKNLLFALRTKNLLQKLNEVLVLSPLLVVLVAPWATAQTDQKEYTFHTDATSGAGTPGDITGLSLLGVTIVGSTGSDRIVAWEVSDAIGTYSPIMCTNILTLAQASVAAASSTTPQRWQCPVAGFKRFQARITGGSTGTITVRGLALSRVSSRLNSGPSGGGGPTSFDEILSGTNLSAAMVVGTGSTISTSGGGVINATTALLAAEASAWDHTPTPCLTPNFVRAIADDGTLTCAQVQFSELSGVATDAQIPHLNTLSSGLTPSRCVETNISGFLSTTSTPCGTLTGPVAFDLLSSGTNTTATMIVDTGASLAPANGGTITATNFPSNPANCSSPQVARGINALGVCEGTQLQFSEIGGTIDDAQVPPLNTLSTTLTPSRCVQTDANGLLVSTASTCGAGSGLSDGDKGDVTVSNGGTTFTIDNTVVTYAKMQNVSTTDRILGRDSAGAGIVEEITPTALKTMLALENVNNTSDATKNVATAVALSTNPANCTTPGTYGNGIGANGVPENCTPLVADPGSNGLVNRTSATASTSITSSTVGAVLRVTGLDTFAFGQLNLADPDAIVNDLPLANLAPATNPSLLLGRNSTGPGDWQEITLGANLSMSPTGQLSAAGAGGITDGNKGDVTVSNTGATWTLNNNVVTFSKMADMSTDRLLGRNTAGSGDPEEIPVTGGLEFTDGVGIQRSALTGDVTAPLGSNTTTIASKAVTYAKMQDISTGFRLLGRGDSGPGVPQEITPISPLGIVGTQLGLPGPLNVRINPRICPLGTGSPVTSAALDTNNCDQFIINNLTGSTTFQAPSGVPTNGQWFALRITTTVARDLVFTTGVTDGFSEENGWRFPPRSIAGGTILLYFSYNISTTRWAVAWSSREDYKDTLLVASGGNIAVNCDTTKLGYITITGTVTFQDPVCTPRHGQILRFAIFAAGVFTVNWSGKYSEVTGIPRLTSTTGNGGTKDIVAFQYDLPNDRWEHIATTQSSVTARRRTCVIATEKGGSALSDSDLVVKRRCTIPSSATIEEISIIADSSGTPSINVHRTPATYSATALLSSALASAASGAIACARKTAVSGFSGVTCVATLQNEVTTGEIFLGLTSGTASTNTTDLLVTIHYLLNS